MDTAEQMSNTTVAQTPVAPAPEKKKGGATGILCIVFALIALGMGGYIVYDKVIAKNKDTTNCINTADDNKVDDGGDDEGSTESAGHPGYVVDYIYGSLIVTSDGEAYYSPHYYVDGQGYEIAVKNVEAFGTYGTYSIDVKKINDYAIIGNEQDVYKFTGYKLKNSNVAYISGAIFGNGLSNNNIVIIDKDGKMYAYSLQYTTYDFDNKKIEWTVKDLGELEEYKGAVATMETDEGSGIENIVFFGDGSYKKLDYELFSTK